MIKVSVLRIAEADIRDPFGSERLTEVTILDGEGSYTLRTVSPSRSLEFGVKGYHETMSSLLATVIAEAYRIGKESR